MTRLFCEEIRAGRIRKGDEIWLQDADGWRAHPVSCTIYGYGEDFITIAFDDDHEAIRPKLTETILIMPRLERKLVCDLCGAIVEDLGCAVAIDGRHYCDGEHAYLDGWERCSACNSWRPVDEVEPLLDGGDEWVCSDCISHLEQDANARAVWCDEFSAYATHHHCCGCPEKHRTGCGRG